jgi:gluconate/galactonate dehydratase
MTKPGDLKITDVQVIVMAGNFDWPIVRIETDAGIYGYGEAFGWPSGRMIKKAILDRKLVLLGENPTEIVPLVTRLSLSPFDNVGAKAISGIEMALWDITGKVLGTPVYKLLGGRYRDKVRIYCDCHGGTAIRTLEDYSFDCPEDYTPEAFAANARRIKEMGFTLLKFDLYGAPEELVAQHGAMHSCAHINYYTEVVKTLREEIGWEVDLAIDYTGKSTADAIRILKQVEEYRLSWAEDIILFQGLNVKAMTEVTRAVVTPTLTGESLCGVMAFRALCEGQAIRLLAPDLAVVGGIHEMRKVAELANLHHILVAPHNICSPVGTMAAVHVSATIPNFVGLEYHAVGVPWWQDVVQHEGDIIDERGYIKVPDTPGIGVELNEAVVREHLAEGETYFDARSS